ncbi:hypothetical protein F5X99DRAFT_409869 [Biscogniauxia marginata]|nr:hypothetical protein F5X99DRAFT_409869 [Biscogniauxia marginata]
MAVSETSLEFGCNLPELLAVDLEESSAVFQSRKLTAGAPAPALADDGSKRRYSLQGGSLAPAISSKHDNCSSRFRSLQAEDQRYSQLFTIHVGMQKRYSVASSECSGGMEPPSIATTRDESVVTAATSVDMDRQVSRSPASGKPSSKLPSPPQPKKIPGGSWMDLELDEGAPASPIHIRRHSSMNDIPSPSHYVLGRTDASDPRSMSLTSRAGHADSAKDPFAAFSTTNLLESVEISSPLPPTEKRLARPTKVPQRRSSLNYKDYPVPPQFYISSPRSTLVPSSPSPISPPRSVPKGSSPPKHRPPKIAPPPSRALKLETSMRDEDKMSALSSDSGSDTQEIQRGSNTTVNPEIVSPRNINIENWLESTIDMFANGSQSKPEAVFPSLPLPANVIDTLRVSVSCFPETMLLCSSLSIETIRSRSRRVKHRADSMNSDPRSPLSQSEQQPKQSKWKWLPTSKKQTTPPASPPGIKTKQSFKSDYSEPLCTSNPPSPFGAPRAEWAALKNLFPSGTDYLCDALYAHLLAYNYITSICPRSALISPMSTSAAAAASASAAAFRPSTAKTSSSSDTNIPRSSTASASDGTQIPRKAATLLGLQDDPSAPIPEPPSLSACNRASTLRTKRSYFVMGSGTSNNSHHNHGHRHANSSDSGGLSVAGGSSILTARPTTSGGTRSPPDHSEQILREVRLGLARCIARLVATLRQNSSADTSEGSGGAGSWGGSLKPEEDPLFMRALCEIVRCCEER